MHFLRHRGPDKSGAFHHPGSYDRMAGRQLRRLHTRVVADVTAAGLPNGARVLDVGAGPGRLALAIAGANPGLQVEGIDLSDEMVEHGQRLASEADAERVEFAVADVADLPYPDDSVDLVVSTLSQHHWADREGAASELLRATKPTGQIWIYDIRFALRRVTAAVRAASPRREISRETVRPGRLSLGLIARLTIRA